MPARGPALRARARTRRRAGAIRSVALLQPRPAQLRQAARGARVLGARIAVAEVLAQVERQPLGQQQRSRGPPRDGRRSGLPSPAACSSRGCGCRDAAARRRRAWRGGGAPRTRPAAPPWRARARGRRRWPRTSPPGAERAQRARGCARGRRARRAAAAPRRGPPGRRRRSSRRTVGSSCTPRCRAAGQADQALGVARSPPPRPPHGSPRSRRDPSRVCAWARVMIRQRLLQPRSSRTSSVRWRGARARSWPCRTARRADRRGVCGAEVDLGAVDRPHPVVSGDLGQLHRARDRVVVGQRERLVAQLARAPRELLGQRDAVQERVGRVAVQLDVGGVGSRHQRPLRALEEPAPEHRSWKTTTLRPRSPTSSQ